MEEIYYSPQRRCALFIPYKKQDGEVLFFLQKRAKNIKRLPDYFGFWGEGMQKNETPEQGLLREVREEMNYRPVGYSFLDKYNFVRSEKFAFTLEVGNNFANEIQILEGEYGKYFSEKEIEKEPKLIEDDKVILRDFFKKLRK
ncbi:MAG: NUDIX domain-containing protein [Candidatus Pacebacteria bacterium]|nr:NUDIX domain-containing protein [Candidatus Paceibacterota bacterium]